MGFQLTPNNFDCIGSIKNCPNSLGKLHKEPDCIVDNYGSLQLPLSVTGNSASLGLVRLAEIHLLRGVIYSLSCLLYEYRFLFAKQY